MLEIRGFDGWNDDDRDAGLPRIRNDFVAVDIEFGRVEVTVGIDQHRISTGPSRVIIRARRAGPHSG